MGKDTAMWTFICLLAGVGVTMTGFVSIYIGYSCLGLAAILVLYQTSKWWLKLFTHRQQELAQLQNNDFMSFKTVFARFKEELEKESPEDYHSLGSIMKRQNQSQENDFVIRFGQSINVDIYGKIPSESFKEWVRIDKDLFFYCKIKNGLELYRNDVLEYTDLAIKISDLEKAIKESILYLTDEFINRLYKEVE